MIYFLCFYVSFKLGYGCCHCFGPSVDYVTTIWECLHTQFMCLQCLCGTFESNK